MSRVEDDRRAAAELAEHALPAEEKVLAAAGRALRGESRGGRALLPFLGPAFVASVAYVDPGNFATNIASGARYGYLLLWVVLVSNLMAMLVQSMSAKLGIATGRNLAEVCRDRLPRSVVFALWLQAEVVAMATDLAEFVGAAIGLSLLTGISGLPAGIVIGLVTFGILGLQARGFRAFEIVIAALVAVIVLSFGLQVFVARPSIPGIVGGLINPGFADTGSVVLAAGILGATVMPHVIYLHSALTQRRVVGRNDHERARIFRFELMDIVIAMSIAGAINMAMLITAAAVFFGQPAQVSGDLDQAYAAFGTQIGPLMAAVFGIALLTSGLSSASVGTMAGQIVMQGFIGRRIPLFVRRGLTMLPALLVLALGVDASLALVISQVVLSFGIPFALIPLLLFCRDRQLMGNLVNRRTTTAVAALVVAVIVSLNVFLIGQLLA
jgi:manganese transport protein